MQLLSKHGTTLISLLLDDAGYKMCTFGVPGRSLSAFRELSLCCSRLEFLAITIPALGEKGLCDHDDLIVSLTVQLPSYETDKCKRSAWRTYMRSLL